MKVLFFMSFLALSACAHTPKKDLPASLSLTTITAGIAHPESALYSKEHKAIFVSNVASGNPVEKERVGYISKYTPEGVLVASPWVGGLKAPKGMAIVGNELYVSDVDQVVKIDIFTGKIIQTYIISGAKFLNDMAADGDGNVYVSDMMTDTIHVWGKGEVKVWMKTPALRSPNGLYVEGRDLLMVSWGNPINPKDFTTKNAGALSRIDLSKNDKKVNEEKSLRGNLDGLTMDKEGNLWVSDWMNGDIFKVQKDGVVLKKYNYGQGVADISFAKELDLLLVPQMNENKVLMLKVD